MLRLLSVLALLAALGGATQRAAAAESPEPMNFDSFLQALLPGAGAGMCFGCNVDSTSLGRRAPVNVLVADQKTAAPRLSDTPQTARKQRMGSVARLVKFRVLEDENFAQRAEILAHRMAQRIDEFKDPAETVRPATGAAFLDALVFASQQGPIRNLVIYGHAGSASLYMMEDRGFYRSVSEVAQSTQLVGEGGADKEENLRRSGARDLHDLEMLVRSGDIRFAPDAVIIFTGCAAAGEKDIDPSGIAARFAEIANATVIASLGVTDQSIAGRRLSADEYSRGTWVRFGKDSKPQKLGTRVLDPLSALRSDDGSLVVYRPIEVSPPMPDFPQYWCAALPHDLACGSHAAARVAADAPGLRPIPASLRFAR
jgi:hypothetical protein